MFVVITRLLRHARVLAQAGHQERVAKCVHEANQRGLEARVARHGDLERVIVRFWVLLIVKEAIFDWVTNDEQVVFHYFDQGIELVIQRLIKEVLRLSLLKVVVHGRAHLRVASRKLSLRCQSVGTAPLSGAFAHGREPSCCYVHHGGHVDDFVDSQL